MEKKITNKRWKLAQSFEKDFWDDFTTDSILQDSGKLFIKKSKIYLKIWKKFIKINKNTKILCIGCGPIDIINEIKIGKKYSIDPLADFYKEKFDIDYKSSNLIKGCGENLPYKDNFFDIIILRNVLDHTDNPRKVLSEMKRVLKKRGIVHLEAHYYQKGFLKLTKIWAPFKKIITGKIFNLPHPHMFSLESLKKLISKDFFMVYEEAGRDVGIYDNLQELKSQLKKQKLTKKIPTIFGLLGNINFLAVCKKSNQI